jgi:hypothetical protein
MNEVCLRDRVRGARQSLRLRHVGTCAGNIVCGLVKVLLGLEAPASQRAGSRELRLQIFEAGVCLGDFSFQ